MVKIILDTEDIAMILLIIIWFVIAVRCAIKDKIEENRKKKKEEKDADSD